MLVQDTDKVKDLPSGQVPLTDTTRFSTRDIRLSAALCPLGFDLKVNRQPIVVTIDADTEKRVIDFCHDEWSNHPGMTYTKDGETFRISARDVDQWWRSPLGKYTIEGYDDALDAMRRVGKSRQRMLWKSQNPEPFKSNHSKVDTESLHRASILDACSIPLVGYDTQVNRWVFGEGAEVVYGMIVSGGKPKEPRPLKNDLCIDWMLAWLKYRDWLIQLVKHPDCIPIIEMREGKKILQISSGMDSRERAKWISYL